MRMCFLLFFVILSSCEKQPDKIPSESSCAESYTIFDSWKNVSASIGYDILKDAYFLNHHIPGSVDGMITAYPCELPPRFHLEGKRVIVSGNLFESDHLPDPSLGGQEIRRIDIHQIEFPEDED